MPATLYFDESGKIHDPSVETISRAAVLVERKNLPSLNAAVHGVLAEQSDLADESITELHTRAIWQSEDEFAHLSVENRDLLLQQIWHLFYDHSVMAVSMCIARSDLARLSELAEFWAGQLTESDSSVVRALRNTGVSMRAKKDSAFEETCSEAIVFGAVVGGFSDLIMQKRLKVDTVLDRQYVREIRNWKVLFDVVNRNGVRWITDDFGDIVPFKQTNRQWRLSNNLIDGDSKGYVGLQLADYFAYSARRLSEGKNGPIDPNLGDLSVATKVKGNIGESGHTIEYDRMIFPAQPQEIIRHSYRNIRR